MIHALCRCRQAGCTDTETEVLRQRFLLDLEQGTKPQPLPVNRIRWAMPATTATSTSTTWRYEP